MVKALQTVLAVVKILDVAKGSVLCSTLRHLLVRVHEPLEFMLEEVKVFVHEIPNFERYPIRSVSARQTRCLNLCQVSNLAILLLNQLICQLLRVENASPRGPIARSSNSLG